MTSDFEKYWNEKYPNDERYFAQYENPQAIRDLCRLFAYEAFEYAKGSPQ